MTALEILWPVLGFTVHKRPGTIVESLVKGHEDDGRTGVTLLRGNAEIDGTCQPREVSGGPHHSR